MKTRLLIIIAILVVLFPLVPLVQYHVGNQVMVNDMTVSDSTVLLTSIVFSMISWFLFAWASKSIKVVGIPLSIISSMVLMIPFYDILGPMAAIIVGIVAGFVAFMFHKHMITSDNKSLIITIATVAVSYLTLTIMIAVFPNSKNHQHSLIKRILLDYLTALQSLHYTDKLSFSVHESCSLFCET